MSLSRRQLRTSIAGLALVGVLSSAPLQAAVSAPAASEAALAAIHIDNFGRINERYYRGAQPRGSDFKALASLGVKTIIDLAREGDAGEEANAKAAGMSFLRIPMTTHQAPSAAVIAQFLAVVTNPAKQPVYVHCMGGKHRTGVMTAIYRMTMDGWDARRAFQEMKQYHFGADFLHPEFKEFVETYVVPRPTAAAAPVRSSARRSRG